MTVCGGFHVVSDSLLSDKSHSESPFFSNLHNPNHDGQNRDKKGEGGAKEPLTVSLLITTYRMIANILTEEWRWERVKVT